ncbi:MAG: class C beta-lactamase-related serine hydrolase [Bacteroidetes bacterium]|nr:MAG: class C beta-lactamase-related serine hydrolase [Bacteroidota bacterium]
MPFTSSYMVRFLFVIALLFSSCSRKVAPMSYQYSVPESGDWQTAHFNAYDIDSSRIYQLFNQLNEGDHEIHSILLVVDEKLVIEEYFDEYSRQDRHDLRSVSKSIRSLLMGIAIDRGFIESIDDPIYKYLHHPTPQKNMDSRKEQITIRHLLTMSTGLDCNDWDRHSLGQEDRIYKKDDWLQYFIDLPMVNDPGTVSHYCSMGTVLAMEVIAQAANMPIDEFANQYLFEPLGIENVGWEHTSQKEISSSAYRLSMTPRDMAKIGQLVLNGGAWNGRQIVSEVWIEESTSALTSITGMPYGLLWWRIPLVEGDQKYELIAATGNGGQYIMICPELDMIAVFTGGAYNSEDDKFPFVIMRDIFIHTFKGN